MEGFLSTFPPFRTVCAPQAQGPGREKREGRFMIPQGLNYLEIYKALLSQVNPGLPAPALKGTTKECGVQVNAKVDKPVQCSLGPKTLFCDSDPQSESSRSSSPGCESPDQSVDQSQGEDQDQDQAQYGTPPQNPVRFMRPVSIYSPLCERRVGLNKLSLTSHSHSHSHSDGEPDAEAEAERTTPQRPPKTSTFQFLEQRYGFFHCKKCNIRWESAYVWCISGTNKVYYKQLCRKCQVGFNPYRVESILCKGCSQTCCVCERKQRHINMKRPHRQDLCCRCRGMRLSCDATYSFKYIV